MKLFAQRLQSLRKEKGISQYEIAEKLNMSRSTYSGWESEGKEPGTEMICMLADMFGVSCDYLIGYTDERNHMDEIFFNDSAEFRTHYKNLSVKSKIAVTKAFDSFYLLLNRDMQADRIERLDLYMKLVTEIQRLRSEVGACIDESDGIISDAFTMSNLLALQNELKAGFSSIVDELLQIDMKIACDNRNSDTDSAL